jgi:hypothetical protein
LTVGVVPLSYASASAVLNLLTFSSDYSPKTLWRLERDGYTVECRLLPRAQHVGVLIRVNGRLSMRAHIPSSPMLSGGLKNSD